MVRLPSFSIRSIERPAPCGDQQAALAVQRQAVRSDHEENVFAIGVRLRHAHAPDVIAGVAAVIEVEGNFSFRRQFVNHVRIHVAQEQVAAVALVDPDDAFGESEIVLYEFQFGVGGDERVEGRIQLDDRFVGGRLRLQRAGRNPARTMQAAVIFSCFLHSVQKLRHMRACGFFSLSRVGSQGKVAQPLLACVVFAINVLHGCARARKLTQAGVAVLLKPGTRSTIVICVGLFDFRRTYQQGVYP